MRLRFVELRCIRVIFELEQSGLPVVGVTEIARKLGVSKSYAHSVLKSLAERKLLEYFPRKGFKLSERGRRIAKRLIRTHRILEVLFVEKLGLTAEEACMLARKIDIFIPEDVIERIAQSLGDPKTCPCGKPVPRRSECNSVIVPCV